jgi:branched-chain amino acid transport system ATP-binding protein
VSIVLRTEGLCRDFGGVRAVDHVTIAVEQGELRSIIGPNGAGKTTLFNLLTGKFPPSAGKILLDGKQIGGLPAHAISHYGVARTFQRTNIFPGLTAFENVRLAAQSRRRGNLNVFGSRTGLKGIVERSHEALADMDLADKALQLAAALSHGDQRLLEMAVALVTEPRVLLLDEPMAGMSPAETARTTQIIKRLAARTTILLIEHDMDVVLTISDRITVMHFGKVIAEGSPQEVQNDREVQRAYLGV